MRDASSRLRRITRTWLLITALPVALPARADTVFVDFQGDNTVDPTITFVFPNITVEHDTLGLGKFTAFGYSAASFEIVKNTMLEKLREDFSGLNMTFTAVQPEGRPGSDFKVYGIDDTGFTFTVNCSNGLKEGCRLFGKASGFCDLACQGSTVGGFARTWAGSFALDGVHNPYGGSLKSSPILPGPFSAAQVGQALANSAAHEIAHLFNVQHEAKDLNPDLPAEPGNLMETDSERVMATTNKAFSSQARTQLESILLAPPKISIDKISANEPCCSSRSVTFTLRLTHPFASDVTVTAKTLDGLAKAGTDYVAKTASVTFPAGATTASFPVAILADSLNEGDELFFVELSQPSNASLSIYSSGTCVIHNNANSCSSVVFNTCGKGVFDLAPDQKSVIPTEKVTFSIVWTVPEDKVWRDLKSLDFRIADKEKTALWVRWDEATNTLSGADKNENGKNANQHVRFTEGEAPGAAKVVQTDYALLHLADSSVVGSGPTGKSVTLNLSVSFTPKAGGGSYTLELAPADSSGRDDFANAGNVDVEAFVSPEIVVSPD